MFVADSIITTLQWCLMDKLHDIVVDTLYLFDIREGKYYTYEF